MAQSGDLPVQREFRGLIPELGVQQANPLPCSDLAVGGGTIKGSVSWGSLVKHVYPPQLQR